MIRLILILVLYVGVTVMFYIHHAIKGAVLGYFVQNFGVITIFTWITVLLAYMELGGKQKRNSDISSNHFHRPSNEIEMTFLNSTRPLVSPEPPKYSTLSTCQNLYPEINQNNSNHRPRIMSCQIPESVRFE